MVDCFDRIAVQMTEIALEPVRMLRERAMLAAVTLRTPSNGRRFNVTIEKRFPAGPEHAPVFVWSVVEVGLDAHRLSEGATAAASGPGQVYAQPEDAYWGAIDAICAIPREKSSAQGGT
jgi:hypothetical protein